MKIPLGNVQTKINQQPAKSSPPKEEAKAPPPKKVKDGTSIQTKGKDKEGIPAPTADKPSIPKDAIPEPAQDPPRVQSSFSSYGAVDSASQILPEVVYLAKYRPIISLNGELTLFGRYIKDKLNLLKFTRWSRGEADKSHKLYSESAANAIQSDKEQFQRALVSGKQLSNVLSAAAVSLSQARMGHNLQDLMEKQIDVQKALKDILDGKVEIRDDALKNALATISKDLGDVRNARVLYANWISRTPDDPSGTAVYRKSLSALTQEIGKKDTRRAFAWVEDRDAGLDVQDCYEQIKFLASPSIQNAISVLNGQANIKSVYSPFLASISTVQQAYSKFSSQRKIASLLHSIEKELKYSRMLLNEKNSARLQSDYNFAISQTGNQSFASQLTGVSETFAGYTNSFTNSKSLDSITLRPVSKVGLAAFESDYQSASGGYLTPAPIYYTDALISQFAGITKEDNVTAYRDDIKSVQDAFIAHCSDIDIFSTKSRKNRDKTATDLYNDFILHILVRPEELETKQSIGEEDLDRYTTSNFAKKSISDPVCALMNLATQDSKLLAMLCTYTVIRSYEDLSIYASNFSDKQKQQNQQQTGYQALSTSTTSAAAGKLLDGIISRVSEFVKSNRGSSSQSAGQNFSSIGDVALRESLADVKSPVFFSACELTRDFIKKLDGDERVAPSLLKTRRTAYGYLSDLDLVCSYFYSFALFISTHIGSDVAGTVQKAPVAASDASDHNSKKKKKNNYNPAQEKPVDQNAVVYSITQPKFDITSNRRSVLQDIKLLKTREIAHHVFPLICVDSILKSISLAVDTFRKNKTDFKKIVDTIGPDGFYKLFDEQQISLVRERFDRFEVRYRTDTEVTPVIVQESHPKEFDLAMKLAQHPQRRAPAADNARFIQIGFPRGFSKYSANSDRDKSGRTSPNQKDILRVSIIRTDLELRNVVFKPLYRMFELSRFVDWEFTDRITGVKDIQTTDFAVSTLGKKSVTVGESAFSDRSYDFLSKKDKSLLLSSHLEDVELRYYVSMAVGLDINEDEYPDVTQVSQIIPYDSVTVTERENAEKIRNTSPPPDRSAKKITEDSVAKAEKKVLNKGGTASRDVEKNVDNYLERYNRFGEHTTGANFLQRYLAPSRFDRVFNAIVDPNDFVVDQEKSKLKDDDIEHLVKSGKLEISKDGSIRVGTIPGDVTYEMYTVSVDFVR